jgi:hypothetical protein
MNPRLPGTNSVCLYYIERDGCPEVIEGISKCFEARYGSRPDCRPATVANLLNLPPCSVFVFATHGLDPRPYINNPESRDVYALETASLYPNSDFRETEIHLPGGTVSNYGWLLDEGYLTLLGHSDGPTWFGITEKFVRKFWPGKFVGDSLVFIQACYSFNNRWKSFRDVVKGCGAKVYGGWTWGNTGSTCDDDVRLLFDRLLGADKEKRLSPPQRPFSLSPVLEAMKGKDDYAFDNEIVIMSNMCFDKGDGELGLAPSIEFVQFDEEEKTAALQGFFGSGTPQVRVFVRTTRDRASSDPGYELSCDPPDGSGTVMCRDLPDKGTGSAGYLVAAADYGNGKFVESNPVPVTAWKGRVTLTYTLPGETSESEMGSIDTEVFLRGDIHRARKKPDEVTVPRYAAFAMVKDSVLPQYRGGGTYTSGEPDHYTYTWHGSGALQKGELNTPGGFVDLFGLYQFPADPKHPKLQFLMQTGFEEAVVDVVDKEGNEVVSNCTSPITIMYLAYELHKPDPFITDFLQDCPVAWDPSFDIPSRKIEHLIDYPIINGVKVVTAKLEWTAMKAEYAPDDETQA